MKTNIDLTKDFTMNDLMSTEFFLCFKEYIKRKVEDQKIAKRDRKDAKHPCPDKRKYSCYDAYYRVMNQRYELCWLYEIYYFMKKNRDFNWEEVKFIHKQNWRKEDYISSSSIYYDNYENCRFLKNTESNYVSFECLIDVIKEYVNDGK